MREHNGSTNLAQLAVAIDSLISGVVITDPALPDNPIQFANPAFYCMTGYGPEEILGRNCRFLQGPETDRAVVERLKDSVRAREGFHGTLVNYRKDGSRFVNELIVNPVFDDAGELISFVGLQNDVTARVDAEERARVAQEALRQTNLHLEQRVEERTAALNQSQLEVLTRLARAAEFRDDDTGQHTQRVGRTSRLVAEELGMPLHFQELIELAAPLHDVGKIGISDLILLKPGKLTDLEFSIMQTHAMIGANLLHGGKSEVVEMAERIAACHHERWDGRGYPNKLQGEAIPLEARIVAVADVFDALTHQRTYKPAWPVEEALEEMRRMQGQAFDPAVVTAFFHLEHRALV